VSAAGDIVSAYAAPRSLYVHVPLCRSKCHYCDFYSLPADSVADSGLSSLVEATLARARSLAERFGAPGFRTLYVGGGTPTALPTRLLGRLLEGLASLAPAPLEWTVEANPESVGPEQLELFIRYGVTRLSVGVQSLDDGELSLLGRPHDSKAALAALRLCVDSGLAVSADLISGIPSAAPLQRLEESAARLLELGVTHLSIYDLSLEKGTELAREVERGELRLPDAELAYESWERAVAELGARGFRRYEVSNFAPAGKESLHNLCYWSLDSYLGAGPGAVSTLVGSPGAGGASLRLEEGRGLEAYARRDFKGARETAITPRESAFEAVMMAFRTIFGLDLDIFADRFGIEADKLIGRTLDRWTAHLLPGESPPAAHGRSRRLALDQRGLDVLNRFLGDCLAELEERFPEGIQSPTGS